MHKMLEALTAMHIDNLKTIAYIANNFEQAKHTCAVGDTFPGLTGEEAFLASFK